MKIISFFVAAVVLAVALIQAAVSAEKAVVFSVPTPPTVTSYPSTAQPGQWIYVNGNSWSTQETVSLLLEFDNHEQQTAKCITYGNTSLGCTVPNDPPTMTPTRLYIVTESGGKSSNYGTIVIALPAGAPRITGFNAQSGGYNCYQYLYTNNAFVGTHTKPDDSSNPTKTYPNTQIFLNGNIEVAPTVYMSNQIGITIPELALYSEYTRKTGNITFTIRTALGSHTCENQYQVKNVNTGGFCRPV